MFRIPGVATIRGGAGGGRTSGSGILHSTRCRPFILSSTSKPITTTRRRTLSLSHKSLFSPLSSSCSSFSNFSFNFHFQPQRQQRQQRQALVASSAAAAAAAASVSWYTSRAHPKPTPEYGIKDAIASVLRDAEGRKIKREERWERNKEKRRLRKGVEDDGPYRNQDETIELALNLNLDPRKPGQALRGTVPLPHGTGKTKRILVFISSSSSVDDNIKDELEKAGAALVGDETLIQQIRGGDVSVDTFDVAMATPDIMPKLSSAVARILGPRGLMPNAKTNTIQPADKLVDAVREQSVGSVQYRTDKEGIVHAGLAKASFGSDKILDNIKTFMNEMLDVKPESFGKGKKKGGGGGSKKRGGGKKAKYFLKAHLTATQGKGLRIDLRTVDPTSTYFMGSVPE